MTTTLRCGISVLIIGLSAASARADDVTDWNRTMLRAGLVAGTSPLNMSRVAALAQAAVFDAVNGIDRRYTPIHVDPAGPAGASRRAATVQAAFVILSKLYGAGGVFTPNQQATLDARRTASLLDIAADDNAASMTSGIAWGQTVGDAIWAWRLTDGGFATPPFTFAGSTAIGQWRPTPNDPYPGTSTNGVGFPQFSSMKPWAIDSPSQFRPAGPPLLTSAQYAKDFNETKTMGSLTSATRTADQTIYSLFWNSGTATYLWNNTALTLIDSADGRKDDDDRDHHGDDDRDHHGDGDRDHHNQLLENARLLASLDVAMADAAIGCWDAKYAYNFWRPITAIRETADDGNGATTADPAWTPLFATPAFPEYTSGHSCVSGAAAAVLTNEFGNRVHFDMTSDQMIGVVRSFRRLSDALEEVKNARIFAGIHFRTATEDGTTLGAAVAQHVLDHKFQRVR
jgi:hypothetical protein